MTETFAGARLDRAGEYRADPGWLAARAADPQARAVVATRGGGVLVDADDETRLARVPLPADAHLFLGLLDDTPLFAVDGDRREDATPLRVAAPLLRPDEAALAAHASALLNWHRFHGHCSRCGHATEIADAGYVRRCPNCGAQHHPRTDPVVIMTVCDPETDRVLLGRQASWPPGRYSALAGFVEPGEALEEAVAREVHEETSVAIDPAPRYVASQPWPFPTTLMLGFHATYAGGEPQVRDGELDDVRWFTRDELRAALADTGTLRLPPPEAIAHRLIRDWLGDADG